MEGEWVRDVHNHTWVFQLGEAWVWIAVRPPYCDRGHYVGNVGNVPDIDAADGFPRYFMDLERAKLELAEWLQWRLEGRRR